jgi:hypothetical protein
MNDVTATGTPALGLSLSVNLDKQGQRTLVLQTHVEREASAEDLNAVLDRMARASDRQAAYYELDQERAFLRQEETQARQLAEDLQRIDKTNAARFAASGRKGEYRANPKEEQERNNVVGTQKRYAEAIEARKARIAELEAKLGK